MTDPITAVCDLNRMSPRGMADLLAITQAIALIEHQAQKIKDQRMALTDLEKKNARLRLELIAALVPGDGDVS